jgi:uncharacterized repeat protein (TIGR01451 family)
VNANVQTLVPLLNVNKVASLTNLIPGAVFTYTINVPNVGTTNTTGTTLIDPLPAGITYVTNTTTLNGWACSRHRRDEHALYGRKGNSRAGQTGW